MKVGHDRPGGEQGGKGGGGSEMEWEQWMTVP